MSNTIASLIRNCFRLGGNRQDRLGARDTFRLFGKTTRGKRLPSRSLRLETLEDRQLLSVTHAEYTQICEDYSSFDLPQDVAQVNIIELNSISYQAIQDAITSAMSTSQDDLIVARTTPSNNSVRLPNQTLTIDYNAAEFGSISIVSFGDSLLNLYNSKAVFDIVSGDVNLGGISFTWVGIDNLQSMKDSLIVTSAGADVQTSRALFTQADQTSDLMPSMRAASGPAIASGVTVTATNYYDVEFQLSGNKWAYVAGLTDTGINKIRNGLKTNYGSQDPLSVIGLSTGDFIDAEKGDAQKDSLLCWAATSANMLWYTGWANEEINTSFTSEDKVFDYFKQSWPDEGFRSDWANQWFLNGIRDIESEIEYSMPDVPLEDIQGGDHYPDTNYSDVGRTISITGGTSMQTSMEYLRDQCGVGTSIGWYKEGPGVTKTVRNGGHATTIWGYVYDETYDPETTSYYCSVIMADPDSHKFGGESAPNVLTSYDILWDSKNSQYYFKSYGRYGWLENLAILEARSQTFIVTTEQDSINPDDNKLSLREALAASETNDIILFDDSLKGKTINLSGSQLEIKAGVTIDASSVWDDVNNKPGITVNAQNNSRVFNISDGNATIYVDVELIGLAITGGNVDGSGGGIKCTDENLTLTNCTVSGNTASFNGGGIFTIGGKLTLTNSVISNNVASTLYGGGIASDKSTQILTNCTVSGNSALQGGGGGIHSLSGGEITLYNTIISLNYAKAGTTDFAGNISTDSSNNIIGFDPAFTVAPAFGTDGVLTNADSTDYSLTASSQAIDKGNNDSLDSSIEKDITGAERRVLSWQTAATVDIGAYEFQSTVTKTPETPSLTVTTLEDIVNDTDGVISLREAIAYANNGDTIDFNNTLLDTTDPTAPRTITLVHGALLVNKSITIDASSFGAEIIIDGDNKSSVFVLSGGTEVNPIVLRNLTITNGNAYEGGGIYAYGGVQLIVNCTITDNFAVFGGGIFTEGGSQVLSASFVTHNMATYGGGMYSNNSDQMLLNCSISRNSVQADSPNPDESIGNAAYDGGGIYTCYGKQVLINCTVSGNSSSHNGGGIYACSSTNILRNTIVAGNSADLDENDIYKNVDSSDKPVTVIGNYSLSSFTNWYSPDHVYTYDSTKPLFVDAEHGDFQLVAGSQVIDKGNNDYCTFPGFF